MERMIVFENRKLSEELLKARCARLICLAQS